MHSSSRTSAPARPRRIDTSKRTAATAEPKPHGPGFRREDKNMNTISTSSPRRATAAPAKSFFRAGAAARGPAVQSKLGLQKHSSAPAATAKPKPKSLRVAAASNVAPPPPPPLPPVPPLDPNCNEPSLPCLCCDGRSPQDNNSMFNHNHNNNNTISIRHQLKLQPPPPPPSQRQEGTGVKGPAQPSDSLPQPQASACSPASPEVEKTEESSGVDNKKEREVEEEEENGVDVDIEVDEEEDEEEGNEDDDDDDDDTLVPSCCDCPPSLLDFSLSSSTSSSSTSISSCSDLELDCIDLSMSLSCSQEHAGLSAPLSSQDGTLAQAAEHYPPSPTPPSLPLQVADAAPLRSASCSPPTPCSPDEGYPSAPASPSSDYMGVKGQMGHLGSGVSKLGLLDFLESMGEFGKMERFSQVIQVARWDMDADPRGDLLRDRLDHLDRLEKVNRQVKLAHIARLQEKGLDLGDLEEEDLSDVLDEMGNVDIPWKLYKGRSLAESQEFSDAGVDLTAPSDSEEPLAPDSLTPSPAEPPPRPPKPPTRHVSVNSDLHTYINISREPSSMSLSTSPSPTFSTFSPTSASPSFSTFRCEKPLPPSPPSIPPLPVAQPIPYFALYTAPPTPPSLPSLPPPVPPPRRRHLARKEAQRLAALQAEREKTPFSLPPPTSRPPPLPPPPVISVSASSPPAVPPPPSLPPPPSFHALDVEIRKLLMLAGLTQAELLKLSPELGVCVGGLEEEEEEEEEEAEKVHSGEPPQERGTSKREEGKKEEDYDIDGMTVDGWRDGGNLEIKRDRVIEVEDEEAEREENRDSFRTTSFTEMARRRKRNSGFGANVSLASDNYYSTGLNNTTAAKTNNMTFETFNYSPILSDTPPPPPPRPLPPIPPTLPPLKVCTLPIHSSRPERFDWLMAFSPDGETPPLPPRTSEVVTPPKSKTSSLASSSGSGSGSRVTTFKELRNRSKTNFPATQVITSPEPDPTVITPDPDILYNLKWRREKTDADGIQWEYTSQAQAVFMNPPPLPSLDAFREMFQKGDSGEIGPPEERPSQRMGCSASEGDLTGGERQGDGEMREEEKEEEEKVEVRGRADGGRTLESRTTVSSPPLSLAHPPSQPPPYFLHSALPRYRPGYRNVHPNSSSRPQGPANAEPGIRASDHHATQYSDHHTTQYSDQHTTQYSDQHTTQYSDQHTTQYSDQHTTQYPDQHTTQYSDQHTTQYSDQHTTQYSDHHTAPDTDRDSGYHFGSRFGNDVHPGFMPGFDANGDEGLGPAHLYGNDFKSNIDSVYRYINDSKTKADLDYGFGFESNFDSLYFTDSDKQTHARADKHTPVSSSTHAQGCTTPYKNVDVMMTYAKVHAAAGGVGPADVHACELGDADRRAHSHAAARAERDSTRARACKDLPPLPVWHLYHPKSCPMHRGAPPRLSPIGALSPPHRSGAPPPGLEGSCLHSPLFPRSHTLPALAAPLYYPSLYPPIPPRKPPIPPKLHQAPPLPRALTVGSVSFAGSVQKGDTSWMGEDVKGPQRGLGLSSLCLQEKRALVSVVSVAVEAILAQFSSSRTLVQKALSGDSSVNPSLGRLVLQCLCPALCSLLSDGLKPHQSDLIAGRRPNSVWGLVQASTRPGPSTQALYNLQTRVGQLTQLRQSKQRFNAFLLGLLNIKLLDFWLSHLQSNSDVLETFYRPSSFMRLSLTSCQSLFEELLLLLQPLSLLTFNLDLLFQHHHLEPANHSPEIFSPPNQDLGFRLSPRGSAAKGRSYLESLSELDFGSLEPGAANDEAILPSSANPAAGGLAGSAIGGAAQVKVPVSVGQTSPQLLWVQEKEIRDIAPPSAGEASLSQQAGQVIQQGWGAVLRWGDRLGQNLAELSGSAAGHSPDPEGIARDPLDHQNQARQSAASTQARGDLPRVDSAAAVPWGLGRLFGASKSPTTPTQPTRRPSQWLTPGVTVLTRMVSSSSTPILKRGMEPQGECQIEMERQREVETEEARDKPRPLRSVRTLCEHSGTGAELSFQKGEELVVLGGVDHDWIRCRQGDKEGLVPIGYTSLIM